MEKLKMKTRYKISIIVTVSIIVIYMALPPTMTVILCDDEILSLDDCGPYLDKKYSKLQMFNHFAAMYTDVPALGFSSDRFQSITVDASVILDNKIFAFLSFDLKNSTFTYRCHNHNLGDDYIIVEIINPTIEDLDKNNCGILNQLDGY